jgi:hypothetical protein
MMFAVVCLSIAGIGIGQERKVPPSADNLERVVGADKTLVADFKPDQALLDKFKKLMTGAKLTGMFTIDGRPMDKLVAESYEIEKVEKLPDGDEWAITARIKYGDKDAVFPVPVEVKWAGKTPVITLDNITIPGLGTFSARVLFQGDRYAGTWQHDDKGGHMFGKVELAK